MRRFLAASPIVLAVAALAAQTGSSAWSQTSNPLSEADLTKLIEEGGYSWEDARRIARAELAELRGEEQSVAGLARERLAVEKTKNR